ncbi:MAG: CPBP family intramembrane glutamic endopeptidase [Gammaproteobacteria bacterium]
MNARARRLLIIFALLVAPYLVNGVVNTWLARQAWMYWSFEFLCWAVVPGALLLLAHRVAGIDAAALGCRRRVAGRDSWPLVVVASLLLAATWPPCYEALHALAARSFPPTPLFAYEDMTPRNPPWRLLAVLWYALSAGLVEELIYRGYGWQVCRALPWPRACYLGPVPLIFAAVHWEAGIAAVLVAWVFGVLAALIYLALGNLWPLVVGHAVTDFTVFA